MKRAVKSGAVKPKQLAERCENVIYSGEELQIMGDNSSHFDECCFRIIFKPVLVRV